MCPNIHPSSNSRTVIPLSANLVQTAASPKVEATSGNGIMGGPFLAALCVGAAFMAFLAVDQAHWWRLKADYAFGWLVPVFVIFVVADRWTRLSAVFRVTGPSALPRWIQAALSIAMGGCLTLGLLFFLLGALYRASAGPTQPGSLAFAFGFAGTLVGMAYFNTPAGALGNNPGRGILGAARSDARLRAVSLFIFPALIWSLSAPLATAVENAVSIFLLRRVVAVVFTIFDTLGYSLVQEGNVLILPKGQVGIAEACSGIRSLTGCLFAGSFLAAMFLERTWKKVTLIAAALVFAFLSNLARSLFLTAWAYAYGSDAIEGRLHDATGYAVLAVTSIGLVCLLPLFRARGENLPPVTPAVSR
jgi:exosortase/archaeosortase family protein